MRIDLLVPSRGRPGSVAAMATAAWGTADDPGGVGVLVRVDEDDPALAGYAPSGPLRVVVGPPLEHLSAYWTELATQWSHAPIMQLAADDTRIMTPGWDTVVRAAFGRLPDRLGLAYGIDPLHGHRLATHPFFHRRWVEVLGHVTHPRFGRDWADTWMHQVAGAVERLMPLGIEVDHLHWIRDQGRMDETYERRLGMAEDSRREWDRTAPLRARDAGRLAAAIAREATE